MNTETTQFNNQINTNPYLDINKLEYSKEKKKAVYSIMSQDNLKQIEKNEKDIKNIMYYPTSTKE